MITSLLSFTVSGIFLLLHQGLYNASIFIVFTNVRICPENNILYTFPAADMQHDEHNHYIHGLRKHKSELVAGAMPSVEEELVVFHTTRPPHLSFYQMYTYLSLSTK